MKLQSIVSLLILGTATLAITPAFADTVPTSGIIINSSTKSTTIGNFNSNDTLADIKVESAQIGGAAHGVVVNHEVESGVSGFRNAARTQGKLEIRNGQVKMP
jgi:hypothetical protein